MSTTDEVKWRNLYLEADPLLKSLLKKSHIRWQSLPDGSVVILSSVTRLGYILDSYEGRRDHLGESKYA